MNYAQLQTWVPEPQGRPQWQLWWHRIPALALLKTTPQDPYYHAEGDVWTHTTMVVEALLDSDDFANSTTEQRFILFYAALLHDLAKASTTVIDPISGKIGQPGHSRRGAIDIRILLWHAQVPFELREAICRIVSVHQLPFFVLNSDRQGPPAEWLIRKLSHELDLRLLAAVAEADMRGRHYEHQANVLADIELFRQWAREDGCYGQARVFPDAYTRNLYFRGAAIAPDYACYPQNSCSVTLMSGLPAVGKNTWVDQHRPNLPVVSFDDARDELGLAHGVNTGKVAHYALDKAKIYLRAGQDFVWNATHLSRQMRQKSLDLLYAYHARVELVYLECPPALVFRRNQQRDTSLKNSTIERLLFKWEVPLPTEVDSIIYEVVTD